MNAINDIAKNIKKVFAGPLLAFLLILSGLLCIWALFQIEHCGIQ